MMWPEKILLISSRQDMAGSLIHEEIDRILSEEPEKRERYEHLRVNERLIYLNQNDIPINTEGIIFLSRHSSKDSRPVLTVHVSGNYDSADLGGEPSTLTPAMVPVMHAILKQMAVHAPEGYDVSYEVTHHGPTGLSIPSCFVELGSSSKEWADRNAASAVARSVLNAVPEDVIRIAGFGGTHYAKRQTEIALTTSGGFGHIIPTRQIGELTFNLFRNMIEKSSAQAVSIDRKALSKEEIQRVESFAEKMSIPVLGLTDLSYLQKISLDDYLQIRSLTQEYIPGGTVTIHAFDHVTDPVAFTIPKDLLNETINSYPEDFMSGIETMEIAHISGKGVACHPIFITNQENVTDASEDLIHLCVSILTSRNSESVFDGEILVIPKIRFDPSKARELKIPAGPAYGDLMAGKPVMVDGRCIRPDMVLTRTEKRIHIPEWGRR